MTTIAIIFARGGSKGLLGKNIKLFCGKPLIAWSIMQAKSAHLIDRVVVSTDSVEIAKVAIEYGAEVPFLRPKFLAMDHTPEWLAWQHAVDFFDKEHAINLFVSIPPTAPLRYREDIDNCISDYQTGGVDAVLTYTDAHRNPYFNMVQKDESEYLRLVCSKESGEIHRRQDAPVLYDLTTVAYVVNPALIRNQDSLFSGNIRGIYVPPERAIDIDTQLDFDIAEYLFQRRSLNDFKN
jgi:CMP-N-acetylneuraminic acid synthetase